MNMKSWVFRVLAWSILLFAFCFVVVRACVQSISHDEALTYLWFLDGGSYQLLRFDANNHVLFTFLAKLFVKVFGLSELSLRAVSLLAAAGYYVVCYLFSRKWFGEGPLLVMAVGLLALNPVVVDFSCAARGYGLGLFFLMGAMHILAALVSGERFDPADLPWRKSCCMASVLLALAFASNLTNAVPAASLTIAFAFSILRRARKGPHDTRRQAGNYFRWMVLPGAVAASFLMWPYLIQARPSHFYTGHRSGVDSLRDVFNSSFLYKWTGDFFGTLGEGSPMPGSWQQHTSDAGTFLFLPLLGIALLAGTIILVADSDAGREHESRVRGFFCGASSGCVAQILALHFTLGMKYPLSRTCLYLIPLFTISHLLFAREISFRYPLPILRFAALLVGLFVLVDYGVCLQTRSFRYNSYDARSREAFLSIAEDAKSRAAGAARIGGTAWYEPEIDFYRRRYHAQWLSPYDIKDHSFPLEVQNTLEPADYDYFVYTPANDPGLKGPGVRTIFHDEKTRLSIIVIKKP